ncbi:MAG: outer membrane beta-barrel protein [Verrucomicrobiia bacterium]|jgi:hypothetical protein
MRSTILTVVALLLALGFSAPLWAQDTTRQQLEMLNPTPEGQPTQNQPENETAEPTNDLGRIIVLKRTPRYEPFRVFSDTQYLYNSNVLLVPSHPDQDAVFAQALGASFSPRLIQGLASTVFVRQEFVRYDTLSEFDFDAQTAGLSLQYPVRDWFILSSGFEADQYISRRMDDEFLKDYNLSFGIRRGQYLHSRVFLYYGYQFNWLPTTPGELTSLNNAVFTGVNVALLQPLTLQLAYRLRGLAYYQGGRFDYDQTMNASLVYKFNDYINARAFVSYVNNDSDNPNFSYRGLAGGGGLGLMVRF